MALILGSEALSALARPRSAPQRHEPVRAALRSAQQRDEPVRVPSAVLVELYRGGGNDEAIDVELGRGYARVVTTGARIARIAGHLLTALGAGSELVIDALIVDTAMRLGGGLILTHDPSDFRSARRRPSQRPGLPPSNRSQSTNEPVDDRPAGDRRHSPPPGRLVRGRDLSQSLPAGPLSTAGCTYWSPPPPATVFRERFHEERQARNAAATTPLPLQRRVIVKASPPWTRRAAGRLRRPSDRRGPEGRRAGHVGERPAIKAGRFRITCSRVEVSGRVRQRSDRRPMAGRRSGLGQPPRVTRP